ncbi:hypothetical protein PZH42_28540, partial [Bacteroides cellulosilyticus]
MPSSSSHDQSLPKLYRKNRRFDIILDPSVTEMDEVVVVGYGSQRKSDIATAVASVNIKDIVNSSSTQTLQALLGKISG